ncbi:MAG: Uma2 family endonuclease [Leptospiraceae bacterium]|nr:Uma2 family endonuclease [Leptospiraceae bacterium]
MKPPEEKETYHLIFPEQYPLPPRIQELSRLNTELSLSYQENTLIIREAPPYAFRDYENFLLRLPGFTEELFFQLEELNDETHFEFDDNEEVIVKMSTFALISLLTGAVLTSLFIWAKSRKSGRVYTEDGGYMLESPDGKHLHRMADISYIAYSKASQEEQASWYSRIPIAPSLAVEIVSAKRGLKPALKKMKDIWMANGTELGFVICPFSKKIYIFEISKESYTEQSIFEDFTHPDLPGYKENFSEYAKKIK